ncbi:hypothetical protein ABB25_00910 [Stenotrophomonas koreensis]|uniref:Uncharacterized protein n=1 Tax=Stenotrophomonas koreensis TaxID=266128 RepID=A0A0R0BU83_9GAMM|nr:hypothetical protein [Stenotrophomonas koreensis]KRG60789.1 hypothetical protein ABB25_00910 [Stenotrophomonas koreensis]
MSRAERIAWTLTIALAVYVVPLRIAELAAHRAAYIAEMSAPAASQPNNTHHNKKQEKDDE